MLPVTGAAHMDMEIQCSKLDFSSSVMPDAVF